MHSGCSAHIDLSAITHNFEIIRTLAPKSKILAMIKSNAYGHGLVEVAKTIKNADGFGVACIDEAIVLRKNGINNRILVMRGFTDTEELLIMNSYNLSTVIHNKHQLSILLDTKLPKPIEIWLKVDTGMHRLGLEPEEFIKAYRTLKKQANIQKPIVIMSHLAEANEHESAKTIQQLKLFNKLIHNLSNPVSIANSSAIIDKAETHTEWIRPGLMLYGINPLSKTNKQNLNLIPAMTLKSQIISIKKVKKNEAIGYGSTYKATHDMLMGTAAIGYGDGYPYSAQNGTPILVNDKKCKLIGAVSMDMLNIDLTNAPNTKIGEQVILWGKKLSITEIAKYSNTISYELLCKITKRVRINYC
ncbi:MAG: alanine racemase [Gammaproteobacteria bacterium]|nr:alanine racemase [Gammaproteobacteria bacterium]